MSNNNRIIQYIFVVILLNLFALSNSVIINTPQGKVKGIIKKSLNGREFQTFLKIPYAKPPVENLRFRDPEPFGSWEDELDGTREGAVCLQKYLYDNVKRFHVVGDEDCLFVNVYTPNPKKTKKYPVMVYIHGGGFSCGSSAQDLYGPEYLLDKDIVLVTLNYRLGPLGFASTEDFDMPGNYGLKDQVLALKWVQENIAAYGGNPDSVTIFGQSAGGASVHYHMISPLSKGLFHRAIPMSGTSHCPWALAPSGLNKKRTQDLATLLGCPVESSKLLVDCLRTVSAYTLTNFMTEFTQWDIDPLIPFPPVIEPKEVENAFLTSDPYTEETATIPMMVGITADEGVFRAGLFKTSRNGLDKTLEVMNDNFKEISKISVTIYEDENINYDVLSSEIRKFYFGDKAISKETFQNVVDMYTDSCFMHCAVSAARKHKGPVYFYYFAQKGPHSTSYVMTNSTEYLGVNHGDDTMYLFPMPGMVPTRRHLTTQEKKIEHEMVTMWTNFAIHGDPTPNKKWEKMTSKNINYLHIEEGKFEMRDNLLPKRVNFWKNLIWNSIRFTESSQKDEL